VRHYTYGGDLAHGIRLCIERPEAVNEEFNLSTDLSTTVLELARMIWDMIRSGDQFRYVSDPPYEYDVQKRVPNVEKARRLLGFQAKTPLREVLGIVIPWVKQQVEYGNI
jgi:UDP-glucose 4-epimerase